VLDIAAHVEGARVTMAWSTPPVYTDGDAELDVIAKLLVGPRAGWLRWELVDRLHIASSVSAHEASRVLGSTFTIDATATQGHTARELSDAIDQVLIRLQSRAPDAYAFNGAVADQIIEPLFALERMVARSNRLVECEMFGTKPCVMGLLSRYGAITANRLSYVAKRDLPLDRRVVAEVTPVELAPIAGVLRGRQRGTP
jgi:zinc protease